MSAVMTDYDEYRDAAKKDGEAFIQGQHGGTVLLTDRRGGRIDRRVEVRWPQVDERRQNEGRRSDDVRAVFPANPVGSILSMLAADKNIAPAFTKAIDFRQIKHDDIDAFDVSDSPALGSDE